MDQLLTSIVSGLSAMFGWGSADFLASTSIKKLGTFRTFFWMMVVGFVEITLAMIFITKNYEISFFLIFLIVVSSFVWVVGYLLLYRAFEIGAIPIVSTVVTSQSVFAVIAGIFFFHESLSLLKVLFILLIILGSICVSLDFDFFKQGKINFLKGFKEAAISALLFGIIFLPFNKYLTENADLLFVNFLTRLFSLLILVFIAFFARKTLKLELKNNKDNLVLLSVGVLDVSALLSLSFGLSNGLAVIVAPISQSLSIVTILLAVIFLKEKLKINQIIGIVMTVSGIILLSIF